MDCPFTSVAWDDRLDTLLSESSGDAHVLIYRECVDP